MSICCAFIRPICLLFCLAGVVRADVLEALDSASPGEDQRVEAAAALHALAWAPQGFEVDLQPTASGDEYDGLVTFASPRPSGDAGIDTVRLRWYRAQGVANDTAAPAVLVVHTLHPDMPVATMLARGLRQRGVHAFVIEMPGYASRVGMERRMTGVTTLMHSAQAVADCRRAYDAIAALPGIDRQQIAIQGTSLGSFVATNAAAFDGCFSKTFLFLSGGDGLNILEDGQKDAFHVRGALKHYGYNGEALASLLEPVEPLRLAHRLNPQTTWMFNARDDTVVPARNARLLAEAIGLDDQHLLWMPGNHYTAFVLLPGVLDLIAREMNPVRDNPPSEQ